MGVKMVGKKDAWDIIEVIGKSIFGVVVTALLGTLTYKVNQQNADIASLNSQLQHESRSAEINIKRAEIAKTFFNEFTTSSTFDFKC